MFPVATASRRLPMPFFHSLRHLAAKPHKNTRYTLKIQRQTGKKQVIFLYKMIWQLILTNFECNLKQVISC